MDLLERGYLRAAGRQDRDQITRSLQGMDRRLARLERRLAEVLRDGRDGGR